MSNQAVSGANPDAPYTPAHSTDVIRAAEKDKHGNPIGSEYDLARDDAFRGLQIAVLQLYAGEGFDFRHPEAALVQKGFVVKRWVNSPPSASELATTLEASCQLWIISDGSQKLGTDHLESIRSFFGAGRGVYIWGDNHPYYVDANFVAGALFGGSLSGNSPGDQVVTTKTNSSSCGFMPDHLISRGLELLYEGITIATVQPNAQLEPVVYGSGGNLVVAAFDRDGKRALLDGGFTRLFMKWDTAGTGRYVKNAAAWLVNYERFGRSIFHK